LPDRGSSAGKTRGVNTGASGPKEGAGPRRLRLGATSPRGKSRTVQDEKGRTEKRNTSRGPTGWQDRKGAVEGQTKKRVSAVRPCPGGVIGECNLTLQKKARQRVKAKFRGRLRRAGQQMEPGHGPFGAATSEVPPRDGKQCRNHWWGRVELEGGKLAKGTSRGGGAPKTGGEGVGKERSSDRGPPGKNF